MQVAFSQPIQVSEVAATPQGASELVDELLWHEVEGECRLLARPTLAAAALGALGVGGFLIRRRRR